MYNHSGILEYRVYDTFSGFTKAQWGTHTTQDVFSDARDDFSSNSPALTRRVLDRYGGKNVSIIEVISGRFQRAIPLISACLLDVDLTEPIDVGLTRLYPRLQEQGKILVDDCNDGGRYKAKIGYERFRNELGKPPIRES